MTNSADVYAGVASYINTGDKNIETSTNVVYGAGTTTAARVSRGDSTIGAPNGPYEVCITDTSATSGVCAKNATFEPGALKFSIFGRTLVGPKYTSRFKFGLFWCSHGVTSCGLRRK